MQLYGGLHAVEAKPEQQFIFLGWLIAARFWQICKQST